MLKDKKYHGGSRFRRQLCPTPEGTKGRIRDIAEAHIAGTQTSKVEAVLFRDKEGGLGESGKQTFEEEVLDMRWCPVGAQW